MRLVLLRGLPGSGKTPYAARLVVQEGFKRISLQDLRDSIDNGIRNKANDNYMFSLVNKMIEDGLSKGYGVVVDHYNLSPKAVEWARRLGRRAGVDVHIVDFKITLEEALSRDLDRSYGRVGKQAINNMYNNFIKGSDLDVG